MSNRFIFGFLILAVSSCTVYKDFPIEVYKPGAVDLQKEGLNVAIVSRNFKYPGDTLQNYYQKDFRLVRDKKNVNLNTDSLAVSNAMAGLAKALKRDGNFNRVEVFPPDLIKLHMADKLSAFRWETVDNLLSSANADILISVETLSCFYSTYSSSATGEPPSAEVITASVWCVYDPAGKKITDRKQMIDTIYWDGYDENMNRTNMKMPGRIDAIKMACEIAGENYAKRITPSWQKVYRMYVIPPVEDFRQAAVYFEEGEWNKAIDILRIYAPEKFRKLAIGARYNIAFAYEMMDDMPNALVWIGYAMDLAVSLKSKEDLKMILAYRKVLAQRKTELEKLKQQNYPE